ncbi:MAG: hypothetical protein [Enterobacteria phage RP5]|uniref:Uncharacterized protein n=2 Tax=Escherichia phage T5 TaxID=2695836 RepID=Q6QGM1_BPT5|nr:hypothetical protein T5.066 [Escherichia phage T5]AAS77112.1 hypothetical protein T5.066 [Escherichia phage T5]AAU05217.1 hypothetical protein T5p064 [Escherichia phage T5]ULG02047.1 MAG: hypothetical protein [Enterobacteria phage RP5]
MKYKIASVFMCTWVIPIVIVGFNIDNFSMIEKVIGLSTGFTMLGLSMLWLKK